MAQPDSGVWSWSVLKPMRIRNSAVPCVEVFWMWIMAKKIIVFTTLVLMYSVNPAPSPPNWISSLASDKLHILNQRLQACLSSYLRVDSTCPICRKPLKASWLLIDFRPAYPHTCVWTPPVPSAGSRLKLADYWWFQACLSSYLRVNSTCPICRKPLKTSWLLMILMISGLPVLIPACELNLPHLPEAA